MRLLIYGLIAIAEGNKEALPVITFECLVKDYEENLFPGIKLGPQYLYSLQYMYKAMDIAGSLGEFGKEFLESVGTVRNNLETTLIAKTQKVLVLLRLLAAARLALSKEIEPARELLRNIQGDDSLLETSLDGIRNVCGDRDPNRNLADGVPRVSLGPGYLDQAEPIPCELYVQDLFVGFLVGWARSVKTVRFALEGGLSSFSQFAGEYNVDATRSFVDDKLLSMFEGIVSAFLDDQEPVASIETFFTNARLIDVFKTDELPILDYCPEGVSYSDPWGLPMPEPATGKRSHCRRLMCELEESIKTLVDEYLKLDRWNVEVDWSFFDEAPKTDILWERTLTKIEGALELHLSETKQDDVNQVPNILRLLAAARVWKQASLRNAILENLTDEDKVDWYAQGLTKICQIRRFANCYDLYSQTTCHIEGFELAIGWEIVRGIYMENKWDMKRIDQIEKGLVACHVLDPLKISFEAENEGEMSFYARFRKVVLSASNLTPKELQASVENNLYVERFSQRCI
jgi:hypothetical protein